MALSQSNSTRKPSGGRFHSYRKKKLFDLGSDPSFTKLGKPRKHKMRTLGGNRKIVLLSEDTANVYDPKSKAYKKIKIKTISGNPANRHFIRRNIMTKGAVIETELGKAKITSRPGQDGVINAVLI